MGKTSEMNLTKGRLFWKIPRFVLPLMMTSIFQLLYTTVDLWTVAKFGGGSLSMSAIGSNSALINLILTFIFSIASGANVCISVAKGQNNKEKAEKILHTSFLIAVFGGIIFGLIGFFAAPSLLKVLGTPASIYDNAVRYVKIYFIGTPLIMIYNFGSNMLRALGDSKRPLYILVISGLVNVAFDFLFVLNGMDVAGVALATIISQGVSAILVICWFTFNKRGFVNFRFKKLKFSKQDFKEILRIGVPGGLQGIAFCLPNVLIQSSLYTITDYYIKGIYISQENILAGASASAQIEGYCFVMLDAFAMGIISVAGQNYGAKNEKNIKRAYLYSQAWMMIFWAVSTTICLTCTKGLLSIFVKQDATITVEHAIMAGKQRLWLMSITYFLDGIMDINGNYLRGLKIATVPAIVTIIGCTGTRVLFLLTLFKTPYFHTIFWLYAAFPISWILVNIAYCFILPIFQKKAFIKMMEQPDQLQTA